jgi:Zn-dependent protease with chaperone function
MLVATTAATIALFYVFIAASMLGLLLWLGLFFGVLVLAARFGLAGFIAKFIERDLRLLTLLARSLWLSESANYRLPLQRGDAPRLFAMVEGLAARLGIPPPDEICLEMSCGAWVELRGIKRELGTTRVGVGYDLLACLNEKEVEAVMAHELVHAKLIGRAFQNWLRGGMARAANVSHQLSHTVDLYRRANESFVFGDWVLAGADALTRLCARQIAACSRQGEFDADRGAAQLCGSGPLRSSLARLDRTHAKLVRLPWNERVSRIESPEGLGRWLQQELADTASETEARSPEIFDRYSTHPSHRDRLAALPPDDSPPVESPAGLGLLADPDRIALKLVDAIEATLREQERKDLRELKKWVRSIRPSGTWRAAQLPGLLLILGSAVVGVVGLFMGEWQFALLLLLLGLPLGIWLNRLGFYRDRQMLPVPDFPTFLRARKNFPIPDVREKEKPIEAEMRALIAHEKSKRRKVARLVEEAYAALGRAEYLRAHVAARVCTELDQKTVERAIAMMVSAAAFSQHDVTNPLVLFVLKKTAVRSPSSAWGLGWVMMLNGEWSRAEALLHEVLQRRPNDANLRAMLAFCQGRRNKLQSAIETMRELCTPRAPSEEHLDVLINLLLDRGALREAAARMAEYTPGTAPDPDRAYQRIRLHVMRRELAETDQLLEALDVAKLPGARLVMFGLLYEDARVDATAVKFFQAALERGHYPQALLALARSASQARDHTRAREHIFAALDTTKTLGEGAASAYDVFQAALAQLLNLEEPIAECRAWIAGVLPGKQAGPLSKHAVVVFARTEKEAGTYFQDLIRATQPAAAPVAGAYLDVKFAPGDLQPARPVRPGVQYVYR